MKRFVEGQDRLTGSRGAPASGGRQAAREIGRGLHRVAARQARPGACHRGGERWNRGRSCSACSGS